MAFTQWYKSVCDKLTKTGEIKVLEVDFVKQINDFGRINVLYQNNDLLSEAVDKSYIKKSNKSSDSYRAVGNKLYSSLSLHNAVQAYTRAIKYAEPKSKSLSLAYANRSAVFHEMDEFAFCKVDIELAFENCYPEELHYKLYERLGKCYQCKGMYKDAVHNFNRSLETVSKSNLTKAKQEEKSIGLALAIDRCNDLQDSCGNFDCENFLYESKIPAIPDCNNVYLSASQSFSMKCDKEHGRYAVATRDIGAGEVIIVEKPFASICLPNCYETHCYNCFTRFKFSYPCRNCSSISYCSINCEKSSWLSFHQFECSYMNLLINDDVGLGHLAMKVVLKSSINELKQYPELYETNQNDFGLSEGAVFDSGSYFCLFSLVGNSEARKLSDLFRRSLLAIYLTKILQNTGYVESSNTNLQLIVAGHLLKQIQMLPCNAHEVSEAQLVGSDLASNELKEIGSAAYTTLSLLNHSCDPSVVRHCYRDVCVLRALKYIKKGDEIIDNYGFLYAVQEKQERIKHLQDQYYFTCQCKPCIEKWPLYQSLKDDLPTFRCDLCGGHIDNKTFKCIRCGTKDADVAQFHVKNMQENYQATVQKVLESENDESDIDTCLKVLLEYLDLLTRKAVLPNIHVNNCQEVVKLCFSLSANFARL